MIVGLTIGVLFLCMVGLNACKDFNRSQARKNAENNVKITSINIQRAQQQARIVAAQDATVKAQADQRIIAAMGIRRAQDEISKTLTPYYIQWEAIQAQLKMATSGNNNTSIYIPSGANGVPLVTPTTGSQALSK
jgi:regulator of protease activity HflC (stomatin/prohibitin superfamily)